MMTERFALISVSDKTGVVEFAKSLVDLGYHIISTGGTKSLLDSEGISAIGIEEVTGFKEMLDGRVKTLHPMIHGALLGKRDNQDHMNILAEYNMPNIDVVCVNLYPFKETMMNPTMTEEDIIEQIDIGGPSMLRSASKNFATQTVLVDQADYTNILAELRAAGETTLSTRRELAAKVFQHTASYDALIADYLTKQADLELPESLTLTFDLISPLRYGENSHQQAWFYQQNLPKQTDITQAYQCHGKELSYNNIKDADAALSLLREYQEPAAVALKHMNPCGVGFGLTIEEAFDYAYKSDPISIFGGIVALNREVTHDLAAQLNTIFLEIVIAPSFSKEALDLLKQKKNIRLLTLPMTAPKEESTLEYVSISGGLLVQEKDEICQDESSWKVVTKRVPTKEEYQGLRHMWPVVKHVKSNAIVVGNASHTLGIGAGQMNRVGSVKLAVEQAGDLAQGAVLASDAFFPMADSIELAAKHGITAIIQPGGSIKDQESINMANEYDIAMIMTNERHFKH